MPRALITMHTRLLAVVLATVVTSSALSGAAPSQTRAVLRTYHLVGLPIVTYTRYPGSEYAVYWVYARFDHALPGDGHTAYVEFRLVISRGSHYHVTFDRRRFCYGQYLEQLKLGRRYRAYPGRRTRLNIFIYRTAPDGTEKTQFIKTIVQLRYVKGGGFDVPDPRWARALGCHPS